MRRGQSGNAIERGTCLNATALIECVCVCVVIIEREELSMDRCWCRPELSERFWRHWSM